jgi:hypothetical protein
MEQVSSLRGPRGTQIYKQLVDFLFRGRAPSDPLAVGRDQVFGVRDHPVEATTARHYVPRRGTVVGNESVVAVSAAEGILGNFAQFTVDKPVGTFSTH